MNKALSVLLIIAVAAGIVPLVRSIEASSLTARREGASLRVDSAPDYEAHPADCPNARHTPLYGI